MKQRFFLLLTLGAAACSGGAAQVPPAIPTTTNATLEAATPTPAPTSEPAATPAMPEAAAPVEPTHPARTPDACERWWACASVTLDDARKVEKRTTLLLGDPAFAETRSGTTDGRNPVVVTMDTGEVLSIALRRMANKKSVVVMRSGKSADKLGPEVVIDRHDGDDFSYLGVIATAQDGKAFVDVRYQR